MQYLENCLANTCGTGPTAFPLSPSGPVFFGSGSSRVQVVPTGIGNLPRNSVREPGERNLNISLSRTLPIHDSVKFMFRIDAFNALNLVNLGPPSTALAVSENSAGQAYFNSPNFGQITSALDARKLQLSARIYF